MPRQRKPAPVPDYDFDADIDTPAADIAAMYAEGRDYAAQEQAREEDARRAYERAEEMAANRDAIDWRQSFREGLIGAGHTIEEWLHGQDIPLHSLQAETAAASVGRSWRTLGERDYAPGPRRCRITSLSAGRRAAAYNAQRQQERAEAAAQGIAPLPIVLPPSAVYTVPDPTPYFDDEGTLEPLCDLSGITRRPSRWESFKVCACLSIAPIGALIAQGRALLNPQAVIRQSRITQTTPHLIETDVTDYRAPVKLATIKDPSCELSKSSKKPCSAPHTANSTTRANIALVRFGVSSRIYAASAQHRPTRFAANLAGIQRHRRTSRYHEARHRTAKLTPRHKSARSVAQSAKNHHHTRLHRLQSHTTRLDRATPAIRAGAHTVMERFAQLGPLE